jgi:hypothetical protein
MRKWMFFLAALVISTSVSAQYKKAGFFDRGGRTYELGTQLNAFGKGRGTPIGFKIGFGGDRDGKQFFSCWDIQYIPSYKFSFTALDDINGATVNVNGTAKSTLVYAANYNFHLLKNDGETQRVVKPFLGAGFVMTFTGGLKTQDPEDAYYLNQQVIDQPFTVGAGAHAGALIGFTPTLGVKLQAGYNYTFTFNDDFRGTEVKGYSLFPSHPYASLTLRLRVASKE